MRDEERAGREQGREGRVRNAMASHRLASARRVCALHHRGQLKETPSGRHLAVVAQRPRQCTSSMALYNSTLMAELLRCWLVDSSSPASPTAHSAPLYISIVFVSPSPCLAQARGASRARSGWCVCRRLISRSSPALPSLDYPPPKGRAGR